jgi:hypothetical protein
MRPRLWASVPLLVTAIADHCAGSQATAMWHRPTASADLNAFIGDTEVSPVGQH